MNEFVKAFRQFLYRDTFYILGGVTILASYLYSFGPNQNFLTHDYANYPLVILYVIGICYPIGYLSQALFNVLGFTTSSIPDSPATEFLGFYKKFRYEDYEVEGKDARKNETEVFDNLEQGDPNLGRLERLIALKQMGTTLGPSFVTSGFMILAKSLIDRNWQQSVQVHWPLLVLGTLLIVFSWVKVMDQAALVNRLHSMQKNKIRQTAKSKK